MNILVACEFSGVVTEAFRKRGHNAWSCDLIFSENPTRHLVCDVRTLLNNGWDMMIAFPPCTDLAVSGARWFPQKRADGSQQRSIEFFMELANANIDKICIENPIGIMSKLFRKPDQIIQPWQFGHEEQKSTCLWLKNLPKLEPTCIVGKGEFVIHGGKKLPKWYSNCPGSSRGQRSKNRSRTYKGIAEAMAAQWG